jgi:hypothetical protein
MQYKKTLPNPIILFITALLTWLPFPLIVLFDIFVVELYHRSVFPLLKLPYFKRSDYIQVRDREKLKYLSRLEKLGCMYCGYVNGLAAYFKAIVNLSEKYWCGIIHENKNLVGNEHQTELDFSKFDDEEDFKSKY